MLGRLRSAALLVGLLVMPAAGTGVPPVAGNPPPDGTQTDAFVVHRYEMSARIRPLLLFWIRRSNVGGATITWRRAPGVVDYSLLIGSDPDRVPRRINRWGYIDERVTGSNASLIGLMTVSGEQSIAEVEASLKNEVDGQAFRIIRASVDGQRANALVTTVVTPEDYTYRQLDEVLDRIPPESALDPLPTIELPAGTRPGFLTALADLVHLTVRRVNRTDAAGDPAPVRYVYDGRMYQLRAVGVRPRDEVRVGNRRYRGVLAARFENRNLSSGATTRFEMTYGTTGAMREIPITMSYQPRWWLRVDLALADGEGPRADDAPR